MRFFAPARTCWHVLSSLIRRPINRTLFMGPPCFFIAAISVLPRMGVHRPHARIVVKEKSSLFSACGLALRLALCGALSRKRKFKSGSYFSSLAIAFLFPRIQIIPNFSVFVLIPGRASQLAMAAVSKTAELNSLEGSTPSPSAATQTCGT